MSSVAAATSQAPVTTPTTAQQSAPAAATPTPTPTSASQAQTTAQQTTAAPTSSSNPAANSSSSSASSTAAASSATSATSSSTSESRNPSSSSSSSSKASVTSSISYVVQTSDGQVFTSTSVVTLPASSPSQSGSSGQSSPSFFHNTGAVAGVFSVVGIIGLVLVFILFTSYIRRRRARKFDREIDEAAAAAANAQVPDFDDFDYTSGTGIGYGQYSETSHGTYNQPPLSHERSRNNLNDIPSSFDTYNNVGGAGSGAAGVGARGRSLRGGVQDPFGALTNAPEQYEMTESRQSWNQGPPHGGTEITTYDMLQAAGMSGSDPYAVTRAPSTRLGKNPSLSGSGLNVLTRRQSQGTTTLPTTAEDYLMPTAAPAYPGGQDGPYPNEKARYSGSHATPATGDADVYGGYQDQPSASLDNPHSPGLPGPRAQDEHEDVAEQFEPGPHLREEPARASLADDEDYGYNVGNRVLRVANE